MNLDERTREIVSRLAKGTPLDAWDIQITVGPIPGDDEPASDVSFIEPEERRALLRLDPDWPERTILTLEELVAHELGHVLIADLTVEGPLQMVGVTRFGCCRLCWLDGQCVQGARTYSPQPADLRLLPIPTSCSRIAENNLN